jgi:hypothetical protein
MNQRQGDFIVELCCYGTVYGSGGKGAQNVARKLSDTR